MRVMTERVLSIPKQPKFKKDDDALVFLDKFQQWNKLCGRADPQDFINFLPFSFEDPHVERWFLRLKPEQRQVWEVFAKEFKKEYGMIDVQAQTAASRD